MYFLSETELGKNIVLILLSILVGLIIGTEREYHGKSAGLRTFILVSFGSCLFTILSFKFGENSPDRIAANIVTGIGFLGAGVIFKDENKIAGITTATTIWATAALGLAIGTNNILLGVLGSIMVILILNVLYYFQRYIDGLNKIRDYTLKVYNPIDIDYCKQLITSNKMKFDLFSEEKNEENIIVVFRVTGGNKRHLTFVEMLRNDEVIKYFAY